MPINTAQTFEQILMNLSILRYIFKSKTKRGQYDLNKHAESFFRDVLNLTYGWSLQDMNQIQPNYPAIDLGDSKTKVCVQITAENSSIKIAKTIEKFEEKKLFDTYDQLIILIITDKKSYTKKFVTSFGFTASRDIRDIDDVLQAVEHLPLERMEKLRAYIAEEVRPLFASIVESDSIFASAEPIVDKPPQTAGAFLKARGFDLDDEYRQREFHSIQRIHSRLMKLSRRAREYLAFIIVRGESTRRPGGDRITIPPTELDNMSGLSETELRGHYQAAEIAGFADIDYEEYPVVLELRADMDSGTDFFEGLKTFCNTERRIRQVLVDGDFTALD